MFEHSVLAMGDTKYADLRDESRRNPSQRNRHALSLGSTRTQIVRLVRDSVCMVAIGVAAGVLLALLAMGAAEALLFGRSATSSPMFAAAVVCAGGGSILPGARHASTRPSS
jgi:hypothetical protein